MKYTYRYTDLTPDPESITDYQRDYELDLRDLEGNCDLGYLSRNRDRIIAGYRKGLEEFICDNKDRIKGFTGDLEKKQAISRIIGLPPIILDTESKKPLIEPVECLANSQKLAEAGIIVLDYKEIKDLINERGQGQNSGFKEGLPIKEEQTRAFAKIIKGKINKIRSSHPNMLYLPEIDLIFAIQEGISNNYRTNRKSEKRTDRWFYSANYVADPTIADYSVVDFNARRLDLSPNQWSTLNEILAASQSRAQILNNIRNIAA